MRTKTILIPFLFMVTAYCVFFVVGCAFLSPRLCWEGPSKYAVYYTKGNKHSDTGSSSILAVLIIKSDNVTQGDIKVSIVLQGGKNRDLKIYFVNHDQYLSDQDRTKLKNAKPHFLLKDSEGHQFHLSEIKQDQDRHGIVALVSTVSVEECRRHIKIGDSKYLLTLALTFTREGKEEKMIIDNIVTDIKFIEEL